ncbi:MAG: pilus assembly PilX N-terminal domain-containing protein [Gammaproteobacteria bacterium]|nr:pilus assembly PilX N-terminal domain-containing protein [Gammaproteobacteria bacterium]
MKTMNLPNRQRGVALAVAMILLLGVTVVSVASLNTSLLELVMAGNEEARMSAFQKAQAGLDAVEKELCTDYVAFFAPYDTTGASSCTSGGFDGKTCDNTTLALPADYDDPDDLANTQIRVARFAQVERSSPRGDDSVDPADFDNVSCSVGYRPSSAAKTYASLIFESKYDAIASRGGRAQLAQGYLIELGSSSDDGAPTIDFDPSL